jgi:hypothetical protein
MSLFPRRFLAFGTLQLIVLLGAAATGSESFPGPEARTIIVTSTADSGAGSLRQALADANDGDTIQFDPALNGQTITLTSDELVIDSDISINGPGPALLAVVKTPSLPPYFRIFHVMPSRSVVIEGLTISNGNASGEVGGGILNDNDAELTISNCIVSDNVSDAGGGGGGIYSSGTLTVVNSIVSDNWAGFTFGFPIGTGGGIRGFGTITIIHSTISNNTALFEGGGIYLATGTFAIIDSTISDNWAGSNFNGSGRGGGIYYIGGGGSSLKVENSTISGNTASSTTQLGIGGGIFSETGAVLAIVNSSLSGNFAYQSGGGVAGGTLTINHSTISGNRSNGGAGGISTGGSETLDIGNTILNRGASGANIVNNGGMVTSRGYNLSSDSGGGFLTAAGDQINTNPMLGPLQNNGGPTFTHAPLPGSLAVNAGDPTFTPPPSTDQRGYGRVFNGRIDIGSVEVQPTPTPGPTPTPTATPTSTPTATATPQGTPSPTATPTSTPAATVTPTPTPSPAQALNISTRLRVETGDNALIGGFIINGTATKNVAVRGIGPSLAAFGISDALADPTLELRASNGSLILQNDNWQDDSAQAAQLTALGLAPTNSKESALVAPLQPAAYTAILAGKNQGTGVGLVEVYDTNGAADAQLGNISTRGFVRTGENVMIGGFILGGASAPTRVVVRGIGPSLAQFGLSPVLSDPTLELRDSNGAKLVANDNWQDDSASAAQLSAHGFALPYTKESGIFTSLPPGQFTAILAGNNSGIGIGLVEIYNLQ